MMQQEILQVITSIEPTLIALLWKAGLALFLTYLMTSFIRQLSIYVRIRLSDLISKRATVEFEGFLGIVEDISIWGVTIKNSKGDIKVVPLSRWTSYSVIYPNMESCMLQQEQEKENK